jgi:hypothetical protein
LAAVADESVVLGVPRLEHGTGRVSIGLDETGSLEMRRRGVAAADAPAGEPAVSEAPPGDDCEFAAPEAFAVNRAAYHRLGPFDQDLQGPAALIEYCLRARDRGFAVRPVPGCTVQLPASLDLLRPLRRFERDRLVVLARHRGDQLAAALGTFGMFWELQEDDLRTLVRALFVRLHDGATDPVGFLVEQAVALSRGTVSAPVLAARLTRLGDALHELHSIPFEQDSPRLAAIYARLRQLLDEVGDQGPDLAARLDAMLERIRLEIEAKLEFHAIASGVRERFDAELARNHGLRDRLEQGMSELEVLVEQHQAQSAAVDELTRQRAELVDQVHNLEQQVAVLHAHLRTGDEAQRDLIHTIEEGKRLVADGLETDAETSFESLGEVAKALRGILRERHRWILVLLDELVRKRIRIKPRRLAPHEEQFIATHRHLLDQSR